MSFKTDVFKKKGKNAFINNAEKNGLKIVIKNIKAVKGRQSGKGLIGVTFNQEENRYMGFKVLSAREKENVGFHIDENSTLELFDGKELDLSNDNTLKLWQMAKYSPLVSFSKKETGEDGAIFYVYSAEEDSKKKNSREEMEFSAKSHIFNDDPKNFHMRARLLGYDMEGDSSEEVKTILLGVAKTNPAKIESIYNAKTISTKIMVMKGIKQKKITKDGETFMYANTVLGINEDGVVKFLEKQEHKNILEVMRNDIDDVVLDIPKENTKKPITSMKTDELVDFINADGFKHKGKFSGDISKLNRGQLMKVASGKDIE